MKFCNGKINTNFHNNKILREGSQLIYLSVIWIDSVLEHVKIITLKCFKINLNMLLRKKRFLIEKVLAKKFPMKKFSWRKFRWRKLSIKRELYKKGNSKNIRKYFALG